MKNIKGLLAATTLLAGMGVTIFGATTAQAAEGDPVLTANPNGSEEYSTGNVANDTTSGSGTTQVGVGFSGGDLTLNFAPNLDFGTHKVLTEETYDLLASGATPSKDGELGRNLVITDARGTAKGWTVKAQLGNFGASGAAGDTNLLSGATVTINKANKIQAGTIYSETSGFAYDRTDAKAPTASTADIVLNAGAETATTVMGAADGNGSLTWGMDFQPTDAATIFVPMAVQDVQNYVAPINWTLGAEPLS